MYVCILCPGQALSFSEESIDQQLPDTQCGASHREFHVASCRLLHPFKTGVLINRWQPYSDQDMTGSVPICSHCQLCLLLGPSQIHRCQDLNLGESTFILALFPHNMKDQGANPPGDFCSQHPVPIKQSKVRVHIYNSE